MHILKIGMFKNVNCNLKNSYGNFKESNEFNKSNIGRFLSYNL